MLPKKLVNLAKLIRLPLFSANQDDVIARLTTPDLEKIEEFVLQSIRNVPNVLCYFNNDYFQRIQEQSDRPKKTSNSFFH